MFFMVQAFQQITCLLVSVVINFTTHSLVIFLQSNYQKWIPPLIVLMALDYHSKKKQKRYPNTTLLEISQ
jgi:hypothetical protein